MSGLDAIHAAQGILLDVDGTLIDSNDAHARSWLEAVSEDGLSSTYEEIRRRIGEGGDHLLPQLFDISSESPRGKRLGERRGEIFRSRYLGGLKAFPGARDLLELFASRGQKMVIATSSSSRDLALLLEQAGLQNIVGLQVTADDADSSKPDPDILRAALAAGGLSPGTSLMFGDTPYDLEAAQRAGLRAVAFECGGWPASVLAVAGGGAAVGVYAGAWELLGKLR